MDGFKGRIKGSLQLRLSLWLLLAIVLVALVAGAFSFASAFHEAQELQDDLLRQVATLFRDNLSPAPLDLDAATPNDSDEDSRVIVQYLEGGPASRTAVLAISTTLPDGMHTIDVDGATYRVLAQTLAPGRRIAVAQATGFRNEIARDSALRTLMPFIILVPILLVVVADLVRKMFRPIASLAAEIDRREEQDLRPVADHDLPREVRPFVTAINRLLGRVSRSMDKQRQFVADAAHELRSPMTALSLQAERLAEAEMSNAARGQLQKLRQGIERGRSLLDQLLALARAQAATPAPPEQVSVHQAFRRVLEDLLPLAEAKRIDIGVVGEEDVLLRVDPTALQSLVKNLVDNAIRYMPAGGCIDLSVSQEQEAAVLRIKDNGPGIPADERERVFDPFYRVLGSGEIGSGLGLSIVKTIADGMGAAVRLDHTDENVGAGLCVTLRIPNTG